VGFKAEEFESFGVPFKERGSRTNESLEIIRRVLAGESVTLKSKFFDFKNVKVTPEPIQKPHPPIWLGGSRRPRCAVPSAMAMVSRCRRRTGTCTTAMSPS